MKKSIFKTFLILGGIGVSFMSSSGDIGEGGTNPVTGTNEQSCPGCWVNPNPRGNGGHCTACFGRSGDVCTRSTGGNAPKCSK